jgi:hypothetical protein
VKRLLVLLTLLLGACTQHHYLVVQDDVPFYRDATSDVVLATLPRYHHEPLSEEPLPGAQRVPASYRGRAGYLPRDGTDLFSYLTPALDGGDGRDRAVHARLREARLAEVGRDWPAAVVEAVRAGEVQAGMTREQVEVTWGWPTRLERIGERERWVWETKGVKVIHRYEPTVTYGGCRTSHTGFQTRVVWTTYRVPVVNRRMVAFDAEGRVASVDYERTRG